MVKVKFTLFTHTHTQTHTNTPTHTTGIEVTSYQNNNQRKHKGRANIKLDVVIHFKRIETKVVKAFVLDSVTLKSINYR